MSKKWSERTREEKDAILFAPWPRVRYYGRLGAHSGTFDSLDDADNHIWQDVYEEDEPTGLTVRDMFREWPAGQPSRRGRGTL